MPRRFGYAVVACLRTAIVSAATNETGLTISPKRFIFGEILFIDNFSPVVGFANKTDVESVVILPNHWAASRHLRA